jgi:DNA repair protein RecO (recombination protein O)
MPIHITDALILRTYTLGESDRIVVFLTRDRGKKRGVAKNARQSRRRFGGALEPMTRGRVGYFERERRDLVRVDFVEAQRSPLSAAGGDALGYVGYFAELIDEWAQEADPSETMFRLGASMVDAIVAGVPIEPLARYFEYWLLRLEGVYPALVVCPQCEQPTLGEGSVLMAHDRSYVCQGCAHCDATLSPEAMRFLRSLGTRTPSEVTATGASARSLREIEQAHHRLIALYLEKELRSARVVKELRPS